MKYPGIIILMIIFVSLQWSCKKPGDETPPVIFLDSPAESSSFNVGDDIHIKMTVEDETRLERVSYVLESKDQQTVLHERIFYPESREFTLTEDYPIYDSSLISDNYYLHVKAWDGVNYRNIYREIFVQQAPLEFLFLMVHQRTNAGESVLLELDNALNPTVITTLSGDYGQIIVNNQSRILSVAGQYLSPVSTFSLDPFQPYWSIPVIANPPFPYFTGINLDEDLLSVQFYDGYIRYYREDGQITLSANCIQGRIPMASILTGDRIISSELTATGGNSYVNAYYRASGVHEQSVLTNLYVQFFEILDDDNVICFGNLNNDAHVIIYNVLSNTTWVPAALPDGILYSILRIDSDLILLGIDFSLYLYNTANHNVTEYIGGVKGENLCWESLSSRIIATSGKTLNIVNYPIPSLLHSTDLADTIFDIDLVYNRNPY